MRWFVREGDKWEVGVGVSVVECVRERQERRVLFYVFDTPSYLSYKKIMSKR